MASCQDERVIDDPTCRLVFSSDTVRFDTVFTTLGSATAQLMVRNPYANALRISRIGLADGRFFHVNVDGENNLSRMENIEIRGGDSLFVFINVLIDPQSSATPVLVSDVLYFIVNGNRQQVTLEAYGQDAVILRSQKRIAHYDNYCFTADRPYLIYDTMVVHGDVEFRPSARLYFHLGASLYVAGNVKAQGTLAEPILLRGDRLDNLFDSVPYLYAAGQWDGVYLLPDRSLDSVCYDLNYVDVLGGNIGLYCRNDQASRLPYLNLHNSRIHNHALYGLVLQNTNAEVVNTEISNCASYCVYLAGGTHHFVHSTVSSYFNVTNIRIQSASREDVAAVYINNLDKSSPATAASFANCIITGIRSNNLVLATPLPQYYAGCFIGNYLKADSLPTSFASNNVYWQKDDTLSLFRNTYYKYKEYRYYDFRLDSLSPARGIGDSLTAVTYPLDREGNPRPAGKADAGCYQYTEPKD